MKKGMLLALCFSLSMPVFSSMNDIKSVNASSDVIENALNWAVDIANDDTHGYKQITGAERWTSGEMDCSSFVIRAFMQAGVYIDTNRCGNTVGMDNCLTDYGFCRYEFNGMDELQRGDILWRSGHTEIYLGDGKQVGAHGCQPTSSHPGRSSAPGDQDNEISVCSFYGSWTSVFRYGGNLDAVTDEELGIPYPRPTGSPILKNGSRGSGVSWLQSALNKIGYSLTVDGIFESGTENAVRDFQERSGIDVDGKVGNQTITRLVEEVKNHIVPPVPPTPPEPEVPQGRLMSDDEGAGQTIPDGEYWIGSSYSPDYWVDIAGDEIAVSGDNLQMHIREDQVLPKQFDVFVFKYLDNGYYEIRQKGSNQCIDVAYASLDRGTNVQLADANGSAAQQWSVIRTDRGYKLQSKCNSYVLDISGGEYAKKQNLWTWEDNNGIWQRFTLIPYSPSIGQTVPDGVYRIKLAENHDYCMDVSGNAEKGNYEEQTNIQLWGSDGDDLFRIKYNDDGYYIITELSTGLALGVYNQDALKYANVNTNIQLFTNHGKRSERWMIRKNSDDTYTFISQLSGYCLDVRGANFKDGTNIETFSDNGTEAQKWILESELPEGLVVESLPDKKVYLQNEKIDLTGFKAHVKYSYETFIDVTDSAEVKYDFSKSGTSEVKVSYVVDGVKLTDSFNVKVVNSVEGDCNNDGKLTAADAMTLQLYLLNKEDKDFKMGDRLAADINGDGIINIVDLCLIKEMILAL